MEGLLTQRTNEKIGRYSMRKGQLVQGDDAEIPFMDIRIVYLGVKYSHHTV